MYKIIKHYRSLNNIDPDCGSCKSDAIDNLSINKINRKTIENNINTSNCETIYQMFSEEDTGRHTLVSSCVTN